MSRKSTVATSPHEDEAREMLEAGWSPARVHLYLVGRHGKDAGVPSEKALERYRAAGNVRPVKVLPARLVEQALRGLRRKVDVLRTVDDMIAFQEERLVWLRQREIESGQPVREVSLSLRVLDLYLERRQRLARELGLDEVGQQASGDGPDGERNRPVLRIPDDRLRELTELLRWRREEWEVAQAAQARDDGLRDGARDSEDTEILPAAEVGEAAGAWASEPAPDRDAGAGEPAADRDAWASAPPHDGNVGPGVEQKSFSPLQIWMGESPSRRVHDGHRRPAQAEAVHRGGPSLASAGGLSNPSLAGPAMSRPS